MKISDNNLQGDKTAVQKLARHTVFTVITAWSAWQSNPASKSGMKKPAQDAGLQGVPQDAGIVGTRVLPAGSQAQEKKPTYADALAPV